MTFYPNVKNNRAIDDFSNWSRWLFSVNNHLFFINKLECQIDVFLVNTLQRVFFGKNAFYAFRKM